MVIAVQKRERPNKPHNAEPLGFSDTLWLLTRMCWSESPSTRPTAQQLFRHFRDVSHTWVPPPEYPIPDGLDSTSGDEWGIVPGALTSCLFVFIAIMLCFVTPTYLSKPHSCSALLT